MFSAGSMYVSRQKLDCIDFLLMFIAVDVSLINFNNSFFSFFFSSLEVLQVTTNNEAQYA